jgi:uncharacterized protein (TIGR00369 family)
MGTEPTPDAAAAAARPADSPYGSPYAASLGIEIAAVDGESALLRLPFRDANANPGGALHGGVAASLSVVAANAVTRAALGEESGPWHTAAVHVSYLAAAINEAVTARATLLRRGKELCFVAVEVATSAPSGGDGKAIAHAAVAVRARQGKPVATTHSSAGDGGEVAPGPMGERVGRLGFIGGRGIVVDLMKDGRSRLRMPWRETNAASYGRGAEHALRPVEVAAEGGAGSAAASGTHEGAALALLDTAGAMAAWSVTGPGPFKASTPAIQCQVLAPPPAADLVAFGRVVERDDEMFWSEVEVAEAATLRVCARGMVLYRIVV